MDNLSIILRGIIDHSVYLNKFTFVTFYDIEKRFDSLWLEDCITHCGRMVFRVMQFI